MATIILTGGGTAGHCVPALALIPFIKEHFDKIYYIGSKNGIERSLVEKSGIPFYSIPCAKLNRSFTLKNFAMPFRVISGINKAKKLLEELKPDVIFSKGGYVALPVVIAGSSKKIPIISHESDYTMGLANKFTARYCDKILTSFPETASTLKKGIYVGSPLRQELFKNVIKKDIYSQFGFSGKKPIITITGGSQGARVINSAVISALDELLPRFDIIHVCGKGNLSTLKKDGYYQAEYLHNIDQAFKISSLVVTRAGSNTLFEILSLKVPAVPIPLPKGSSRGDQVLNAEYFSKKGLVCVLPQNTLTPKSLTFAINSTYANRFNITRELNANPIQNACPKIADILKNYRR